MSSDGDDPPTLQGEGGAFVAIRFGSFSGEIIYHTTDCPQSPRRKRYLTPEELVTRYPGHDTRECPRCRQPAVNQTQDKSHYKALLAAAESDDQ